MDTQRQALSKLLYGNKYMIDLALLALEAESGLVHVRGIAAELHVADATIKPVVERLVKAGVFTPLPRAGLTQHLEVDTGSAFLKGALAVANELAPRKARSAPKH